jgi:hypothetical protein
MTKPILHDVFKDYCNLLNDTLDMVMHEWDHDLNIGFENLNFQIDGIFIMMHYWCRRHQSMCLLLVSSSNHPFVNILKL